MYMFCKSRSAFGLRVWRIRIRFLPDRVWGVTHYLICSLLRLSDMSFRLRSLFRYETKYMRYKLLFSYMDYVNVWTVVNAESIVRSICLLIQSDHSGKWNMMLCSVYPLLVHDNCVGYFLIWNHYYKLLLIYLSRMMLLNYLNMLFGLLDRLFSFTEWNREA